MLNFIKKILNIENYVSELDQFLKAFDRKHTKHSSAQQFEIDKYRRIHHLRDKTNRIEKAKPFWPNF